MPRTRRAAKERSTEVGSGLPAAGWTLEPSWWRQEMGGADCAGWDIVDRTCSDCGKRRGCRIVEGTIIQWACSSCGPHPKSSGTWCAVGCGRDYIAMDEVIVGDVEVLFLCSRCLVADHLLVSWRVQYQVRSTRRRIERAREHEAAVDAMAGHRVEQ